MSEKIRVKLVDAGGANLQMRYTDPVSGKVVTTTKYVDPSTGEVQRTGKNRKIARKYATLLESDLNAGRTGTGQSTSFQSFRSRYEMEVLPTLSQSVNKKTIQIFNSIEKSFPKVANGKLSFLDAAVISRFQAELRARKIADSTIGNYLAHLRSALSWAHRQKLINSIPSIEFPKATRGYGGYKGKGRAILEEEFDRMLLKIEPALEKLKLRRANDAEQIESWQRMLRGMWLSGLRLSEALALSWDTNDGFAIDLSGKRPRFKIRAESQKGRRDELLPLTPDFAAFILETPLKKRKGRIFRPMGVEGVVCLITASQVISKAGRLAGIKVDTDPKTGKISTATSKSLRKSFGTRWAQKVMPPVLKQLMRHGNISTTMNYYVTIDTDSLAEMLWAQEEEKIEKGYGLGYSTKNDTPAENHLSPYPPRD